MANTSFGSAKRAYVPAARKKAPEPATRLPSELALMSVSRAMRSVAWEGVVPLPPDVPADSGARPRAFPAGVDPLMSARAAFSQVPWTGEKPSTEQTGEQSKRSVRAVLDAFKWE